MIDDLPEAYINELRAALPNAPEPEQIAYVARRVREDIATPAGLHPTHASVLGDLAAVFVGLRPVVRTSDTATHS